jgi:NAD(P)-dependent dehydrogenase (short-subunit alcohol dehydrogenase family)
MKSLPPNPVVLVTGASRGIGREIALAYARRGAQLILAARTAETLAAVGREVEAIGAEVLAIPTDVASSAAVDALIAGTIERFGRIDVLVNNAGIGRVGSATDAGFEPDVHATLNASLFGMIRLTQRVLPLMRTQNSGAIVNMSSVMGRKAFARFGSYAIVMHAVSAFSDALRQELVGTGIHVAVIYPALTATELLRDATVSEMPPPFRHMTPLSSEKVAAAVVSAVMRRQRRVVLPWQANMLLLGEALSPWFGDLIARALTVRFVARLLGMSSGQTYHDTLARRSVARGAFLVAAAVTGAATMLPTPTRAADVMAHMNVVSPGPTDTPEFRARPAEFIEGLKKTTATGRIGQIEEIVNVVAFLASPEAG